MNSLILLSMLVTTTHPTVNYQVITNEFNEYSIYSFEGTKILNTPQNEVYSLDMAACNMHRSYYDIVDETLFFNNNYASPKSRKNSFSFEKDIVGNRCLLVVEKKPLAKKSLYFNNDRIYWYPDYNYISITPKKKTKIFIPRRTKSERHHKKVVAHNVRHKPKIVIKHKKRKHKKQNHRRR